MQYKNIHRIEKNQGHSRTKDGKTYFFKNNSRANRKSRSSSNLKLIKVKQQNKIPLLRMFSRFCILPLNCLQYTLLFCDFFYYLVINFYSFLYIMVLISSFPGEKEISRRFVSLTLITLTLLFVDVTC